MDTPIQDSKKSGAGLFLVTLLFGVPSIIAFGCAFASSHTRWYPSSALWFIYEASRYVAYVGIAVSVGMIVTVAIQRSISSKYIAWMGFSVAATVVILWCAARILIRP